MCSFFSLRFKRNYCCPRQCVLSSNQEASALCFSLWYFFICAWNCHVSLAFTHSVNLIQVYNMSDDLPNLFLYHRFLCRSMNVPSIVMKIYCMQRTQFPGIIPQFMSSDFLPCWNLQMERNHSYFQPYFLSLLLVYKGYLSILLTNHHKTTSPDLILLWLTFQHPARNLHLFLINLISLVWACNCRY